MHARLLGGLTLALVACATGGAPSPTRPDLAAPAPVDPATVAAADAALAARARLDDLITLALARDPTLAGVDDRIAAARARGDAAAALPAPEVKLEAWGIPLGAPWAVGSYDTAMIGVRQRLPPPGVRRGRRAAGALAARQVSLDRQARTQALVFELELAFADYLEAADERAALATQTAITADVIAVTIRLVATGGATPAEVLTAQLDQERLVVEGLAIDERAASAQVRLNLLAGRGFDAPLGPPEPPAEDAAGDLDEAALAAGLATARPELAAARLEVERAEVERHTARLEARWPMVMVGLDYMYMPDRHHDAHAAAAMVAIELPGVWGGAGAAATAAEHDRAAATAAEQAAQRTSRLELALAFTRYRAAVLRRDRHAAQVMPAAERALDAARRSLGTVPGSIVTILGALRAVTDARRDHVLAVAEARRARAEVALAAGATHTRGPR